MYYSKNGLYIKVYYIYIKLLYRYTMFEKNEKKIRYKNCCDKYIRAQANY